MSNNIDICNIYNSNIWEDLYTMLDANICRKKQKIIEFKIE